MLITCPECGHQVSDRAATCPGCGIQIAGYITHPDSEEKPAATGGQTSSSSPQTSGKPAKKPKGKKKSCLLLVISFIIAVAACAVGYFYYEDALKQKEQAEYEYALGSNNQEVMQTYLTRFKDAPMEHRNAIAGRLEEVHQNDADWSNAVVSASKGALEEYMRKHPDSPHKGEVANMIDSIDYAFADRIGTMASYVQYLAQHPDGRHAAEAQEYVNKMKEKEVTPEEADLARTTCRHFFQAINANNESKLLETVTETLSSFLNRTNATSSDVLTYMRRLYSPSDIENMNWHILDDFKVEKKTTEDGVTLLKAQFGAEQHIDRTDPTREHYGKYIVSAEITKDGRITRLNMRKLQTAGQHP